MPLSSDKPLNKAPNGTDDYDQGALNDGQQQKLNQKKIELRIENEKYLRNHPELNLIIQDFLKECYLNKPSDVNEFAAVYFTNPDLNVKVEKLLEQKEKNNELNKIIQQLKMQDLNSKR